VRKEDEAVARQEQGASARHLGTECQGLEGGRGEGMEGGMRG